MFSLTAAEDSAVGYVASTNAVSIDRIIDTTSDRDTVKFGKERDVKVARFGVRFCTRVRFCLGDTVLDMGDYYKLTNNFFLDFIEDISKAATSPLSAIKTDSGLVKTGVKVVPVNNSYTGYMFDKGAFSLDEELVGVVFGNSIRMLMNTGRKMLYSSDFLTSYTFPYILTPLTAKILFSVDDIKPESTTPTDDEKNMLDRWKFLIQ